MATKKAAATKTATKAAAPVKAAAAPAKAVRGPKLPATKMTKTQVIRFMAEQMDVPPKQVGQFFILLIETATAQTKKVGEFTIPGLGKLVKAQRAAWHTTKDEAKSKCWEQACAKCQGSQPLDLSGCSPASPLLCAVLPRYQTTAG